MVMGLDGGVCELRRLLGGDDRAGRLVLRYQPVVSASDAEPLGVEALVRWARPDGTTLSPDAFLPAAEAAGLGAALDEHVLRSALHQVAAWDRTGIRVHRVAVNLGRSSTVRPDLLDVVADATTCAGLRPDRLALEVTEHDELELTQRQLDVLQDVVDAGVTLAIDDFGSGWAGVTYLQALPVGIVKLDRSLLPDPRRPRARSAPDPAAVFTGLAELAAATGAELTAEGVEDRAQLELVRDAGVDHVQGWLFAAALEPPCVLEHWLTWRARHRAAALAR